MDSADAGLANQNPWPLGHFIPRSMCNWSAVSTPSETTSMRRERARVRMASIISAARGSWPSAAKGHRRPLHLGVEYLETGAVASRPVEGHLGVAEDILGPPAVLPLGTYQPEGNPDAQLPPAHAQRAFKRLADPVDDLDRLGRPTHVRDEDSELVTPEPGHRVLRPERLLDADAHGDQQVVAGAGTELLVDLPKAVQVEDEHPGPRTSVQVLQGLAGPPGRVHAEGVGRVAEHLHQAGQPLRPGGNDDGRPGMVGRASLEATGAAVF